MPAGVGQRLADRRHRRSARSARSAPSTARSSGAAISSRRRTPVRRSPPIASTSRLNDGRVVALRVETGEPIWEQRLGGAPNDILALDDRLYAGSKDNFFYCLMTEDGRVDWRWRTGADVVGRPSPTSGRVYFVSLDNVLRAINHSNGVQQWMRPLPFRPGLAAAESRRITVVVAGLAGSARAFNMKDGMAAGELRDRRRQRDRRAAPRLRASAVGARSDGGRGHATRSRKARP